jgi:putative oxidoreductase
VNGGTLVTVYCFVFLYFVFAGPGPLSLDRVIFGRKEEPGRLPAAAE